MRKPVCSCGHGFELHRDGRAECRAEGCVCAGLRPAPLPGVYDLRSARSVLRARSGKSLLERAEETRGRSSSVRPDDV